MAMHANVASIQCRTCFVAAKESYLLESLAFDEISFAELLKEVANINIMDDTNRLLPQHICECCSHKLKMSHTFIKQAQEVNSRLSSLLYQNQRIDCLEEFEIDIQQCMDIKLESNEEDEGHNIMEMPEVKCEQTQDDTDPTATKIGVESYETTTSDIKEEIQPESGDDLQSAPDKTGFSKSDDDKELTKRGTNDTKKATRVKVPHIIQVGSDTGIAVPCVQCNKIFNDSKDLSRHLRNAHVPEDQKCPCPVCGAKFTRSCNMYKHMRTFHETDTVIKVLPTKEKKHKCEKCNCKYAEKKHLNYHIKMKHKNEGETNDELRPRELKNDSKQKSEIRPLCSICGASFSNKAQLIVHTRRHTGEKPFKCDLCEKAFPRISELTCHRRIHTGEKPYKCKICDKAFRVCAKLGAHMRSHTNERPYKCSHCERSFKYSKDLNIHTRTHTGERPYCCTVCGSTFTQSNSLKAHRMKLGHTEEATLTPSPSQLRGQPQLGLP